MNNKQDANVRKSTVVNFQIGLIIALLITVFVIDLKTVSPVPDVAAAPMDDTVIETYIDPSYTVEKKMVEEEIKKEEPKKKLITDVIDVKEDNTPEKLFEDNTELTTTKDPEIVEPGSLDEDIVNPDPEPVNFVTVEFVPIFPGCEGLATNAERRDCMSSKISKLVQNKFDTDLASDQGLRGIQRIYVRFSIDVDGNVTKIKARSPNTSLRKEGERIAKLIPKMEPGKQLDKPVEVIFDLPIIFKVQN